MFCSKPGFWATPMWVVPHGAMKHGWQIYPNQGARASKDMPELLQSPGRIKGLTQHWVWPLWKTWWVSSGLTRGCWANPSLDRPTCRWAVQCFFPPLIYWDLVWYMFFSQTYALLPPASSFKILAPKFPSEMSMCISSAQSRTKRLSRLASC